MQQTFKEHEQRQREQAKEQEETLQPGTEFHVLAAEVRDKLTACEDAIAKALSGDSLKFLDAYVMQGGQ